MKMEKEFFVAKFVLFYRKAKQTGRGLLSPAATSARNICPQLRILFPLGGEMTKIPVLPAKKRRNLNFDI